MEITVKKFSEQIQHRKICLNPDVIGMSYFPVRRRQFPVIFISLDFLVLTPALIQQRGRKVSRQKNTTNMSPLWGSQSWRGLFLPFLTSFSKAGNHITPSGVKSFIPLSLGEGKGVGRSFQAFRLSNIIPKDLVLLCLCQVLRPDTICSRKASGKRITGKPACLWHGLSSFLPLRGFKA